ncbi:hypothetical protein WJX84_011476, partial [Apatococcus fuscideae]
GPLPNSCCLGPHLTRCT